jgi:hypothetical protein
MSGVTSSAAQDCACSASATGSTSPRRMPFTLFNVPLGRAVGTRKFTFSPSTDTTASTKLKRDRDRRVLRRWPPSSRSTAVAVRLREARLRRRGIHEGTWNSAMASRSPKRNAETRCPSSTVELKLASAPGRRGRGSRASAHRARGVSESASRRRSITTPRVQDEATSALNQKQRGW